MNPLSFFKPGIILSLDSRWLAAIIGSSTWAIGIYLKFPAVKALVETAPICGAIVGCILLNFIGKTFDCLVSLIQYRMDLSRGKRHIRKTRQYLLSRVDSGLVGQSNVESLEGQLKFQLGISVAFCGALLGHWVFPISPSLGVLLSHVLILASALFFVWAWSTHGRLSSAKRELTRSVSGTPPANTQKNQTT